MKVILHATLSLALIVLLFCSWLFLQNDLLVEKIKSNDVDDVRSQIQKNTFPILVTEPIKRFLYQVLDVPTIDKRAEIQLVETYLNRKALDAGGWLIASQLYQQAGDIALARDSLAISHLLSKTNMPILSKVFNRYLEMGLIEEASVVAHDIVSAKPGEFRRLFYLMSRLTDDSKYRELIRIMLPASISDRTRETKKIEVDTYYNWALSDALRRKNIMLALAVWEETPIEIRMESKLSLNYMNYLANNQEVELLKSAFSDLAGRQVAPGSMFEIPQSPVSPCWAIREVEDANVSIMKGEAGKQVFHVSFSGGSNLDYYHLSCLVLFEPNSRYKLVGRYRGENISTLSGPYIEVIFPGGRPVSYQNEARIGSWPWINFEIDISVPDEVEVAKIRLRRKSTELLDSKVHGDVWFEVISLNEIDNKIN